MEEKDMNGLDAIDSVVDGKEEATLDNSGEGEPIVPPSHNDDQYVEGTIEPDNGEAADEGVLIVPANPAGEGMMGADVEEFYTDEKSLSNSCLRKYIKGEGIHSKLVLNTTCYVRRDVELNGVSYPCYYETGIKPILLEVLKDGGRRVTYSNGDQHTYKTKEEFNKYEFMETEPSIFVPTTEKAKPTKRWFYTNTTVLCCGNNKGYYRDDFLEEVRKEDEKIIKKLEGKKVLTDKERAVLLKVGEELKRNYDEKMKAEAERDALQSQVEEFETKTKKDKRKEIVKTVVIVALCLTVVGLAVAGHFIAQKVIKDKTSTDNNITPGGDVPVGPDINPDDPGNKNPDPVNPDINPDEEMQKLAALQDELYSIEALRAGDKVVEKIGSNGNTSFYKVENKDGKNCVYSVTKADGTYTTRRYVEYTGEYEQQLGENIVGAGYNAETGTVYVEEMKTVRNVNGDYKYTTEMNAIAVDKDETNIWGKDGIAIAQTDKRVDVNSLVAYTVNPVGSSIKGEVEVNKALGENILTVDAEAQASSDYMNAVADAMDDEDYSK